MTFDCRVPVGAYWDALDECSHPLHSAVDEDENHNDPEELGEAVADEEDSVIKVEYGYFDGECCGLVYHLDGQKRL